MQYFFIFVKKDRLIIFLYNKVFFLQNYFKKKQLFLLYFFKILFNFGLFDFRVFYLLKKI